MTNKRLRIRDRLFLKRSKECMSDLKNSLKHRYFHSRSFIPVDIITPFTYNFILYNHIIRAYYKDYVEIFQSDKRIINKLMDNNLISYVGFFELMIRLFLDIVMDVMLEHIEESEEMKDDLDIDYDSVFEYLLDDIDRYLLDIIFGIDLEYSDPALIDEEIVELIFNILHVVLNAVVNLVEESNFINDVSLILKSLGLKSRNIFIEVYHISIVSKDTIGNVVFLMCKV